MTKKLMTSVLALLITQTSFASVKTGEKAPEFSMLKKYAGKNVVLEWYNPDCPYVKKHYKSKNMQTTQKSVTSKNDFVWLTVLTGKTAKAYGKKVAELKKEQGMSSTDFVLDEDGSIGKMYGAKTTPHMYMIATNGTVAYQGAIDDNDSADPDDVKNAKNYIKAAADEVSSGKKISVAQTESYGCSVKY